MKRDLITYAIIAACFLAVGLALGHYFFSCPPPDPDADIEREVEIRSLKAEADAWRDSADHYKERVDTVYIDRTKIKTVQQHVKALHNASLHTLRDILLVEPSI